MELQDQDGKHMPLRNYANGTVATTWMISYTAVRARSEAAANLLLLWAHLDNKSLQWDLLATASQQSTTAAEQTSKWLGSIGEKEIEFIKAIKILRNYSLVDGTADQKGYMTHPVVHQWALHIQDKSQRAALSWLAIIIIGLAVPTKDKKLYWEMQIRLLPHAEGCKNNAEQVVKDKLEEQGVDRRREENKILFRAVHELGNLYADQGKLDDAEKLYQCALQGYEKAFGLDYKLTLDTVNNLGILYMDPGKLDEAEKLFRRALQGAEKAFGLDHALTLDTVSNLGSLYRNQGKLDEAETMFRRALQGYEKAFGLDHISTLDTVNNLGNLYRSQGKPDKAEKAYERALQGSEKTLGPDHMSTLDTVYNLGNLYTGQSKLDEAEKMYQRASQGYAKLIHPDHISTFIPALNTTWGYASIHDHRGRVDDAIFLYSEVLLGYEKVLGNDHPRCQILRGRRAALEKKRDGNNTLSEGLLVQEQARTQAIIKSSPSQHKSASRRYRLLRRLGWKQQV